MADEGNFYERLGEILDDVRIGHKREWTVDRLDALYGEQQQALAKERDDARAEVERFRADVRELAVLRRDMGAVQAERDAALDEAGTARDEVERFRAEVDSERERNTQAFLAKRKAEREREQMAKAIEGAREQAVAYVERITEAEAERDRARADLAEEKARHGELIAEMQRTRKAADDARGELERIRMRDEPVGSVLYDVIRRAQAGRLDEHEAVRAIERRLIQPFVARMREAQARAGRSAAPRAMPDHHIRTDRDGSTP